ncbi:MAG TPA: hypothetical protein VK640_17475 [Actinomycetes bacterium]|nr:hypothetical protein [Actinomycetes bacterium]
MNHTLRRVLQVASATLFLTFAGSTAAFAGPAPIREEFPPGGSGQGSSAAVGTDFPWLLTSVSAVLAIATVALVAVVWHRTHAGHHGLVTP